MADLSSLPLPDGQTLIFATVGDPIIQVKAPAMMSALLAERQVNGIWLPIAADADALPGVFVALRGWRNFAGLSITVPHKSASLSLVDRVTTRALASGGINLARREPDGSLSGDMVDGVGFVAGLARRGVSVAGKIATIAGCGGAGGAIAASLCEAGVGSLHLVDPDVARRDAMLDRLSRYYPATPMAAAIAMDPASDLAINATPLGMRPDDPLPFDPAVLSPGAMVCDIIMSPAKTRLLVTAESMGHAVQPGLPMLEAQADLYLDYFGVKLKRLIDA